MANLNGFLSNGNIFHESNTTVLLYFHFCARILPKKTDAVLTPQQEEEYARMMRNAPKPTYEQLRDENAKLRSELGEKAMSR